AGRRAGEGRCPRRLRRAVPLPPHSQRPRRAAGPPRRSRGGPRGTPPRGETDDERPRTRGPRGHGAAAALTDAVDGFAYRPDPPTRVVHRGRCRLDWSLAPRVASSCELPQGRKAARVSELWRVHGESTFSKITIPQLPLSPIGPGQFRRSDPDVTRFRAQRRIR